MLKNRLLEIRLSMGFKTAREFAEYLNINTNTYRKYENNLGQPSVDALYDIAKKLKIPIEKIIYKEEG